MTMELITRLRALVNNDEGQDLLEYALLVALIALVCVRRDWARRHEREHHLRQDCRRADDLVVERRTFMKAVWESRAR